jgi:DNA-binding IscR family transcriptional regulator
MGRVVTSETLGPMMKTNPVVLRRTMAGLRDAGIVRSEKGHGGGWSLALELDNVTIGDVYEALGTPALFSMGHRAENPGCLVEKAVNRALGKALGAAEAVLLAELRNASLADLAIDFQRKLSRRTRKGHNTHA